MACSLFFFPLIFFDFLVSNNNKCFVISNVVLYFFLNGFSYEKSVGDFPCISSGSILDPSREGAEDVAEVLGDDAGVILDGVSRGPSCWEVLS